jgi:hypothetical protein
MVHATLSWHEPINLSDVKRALEIETELGRQRPLDSPPAGNGKGALDGELILGEPRDLEPAHDLSHGLGPEGRRHAVGE